MPGNTHGGEPIAAPDDASSGNPNWGVIERALGALKVYVASLGAGENQTLNALETIPANEYLSGSLSGVTSGTAFTLGAVGAAGDYLDEVVIRADGTTTMSGYIVITDGSTTIDALKTAVPADNAAVTISVKAKSKNGAWKITCAATTMANVKYAAKGLFS